MSKPKILLSGKMKYQNYIDAVENTGGISIGKDLPQYSPEYDGLILCGGPDVDPAYYGEPINGSGTIDIERDEAEFALIKAFVEAGKPILGICRGCQVLNVYFGGSLHQHLETAETHRSGTKEDLIHPIRVTENSLLHRLYRESFTVNSFHHQGIRQLGKGLKVTAISDADGVIEAVEHESLPILAFQFHPERMCCSHSRTDTVDGMKIFEYFITLCKES